MHPHPGPRFDEERTPTLEQTYKWKRKSLREDSEDEDMTSDTEPTGKQARASDARGVQNQETRGGTGEQKANPYLDVPGDAVWDEVMQPQKGEKTSELQVDTGREAKKPNGQPTAMRENTPT